MSCRRSHEAELIGGRGGSILGPMTEREQRLRDAFAALDDGDLGPFEALFRPDAQWLGVPGRGWNGETPI